MFPQKQENRVPMRENKNDQVLSSKCKKFSLFNVILTFVRVDRGRSNLHFKKRYTVGKGERDS